MPSLGDCWWRTSRFVLPNECDVKDRSNLGVFRLFWVSHVCWSSSVSPVPIAQGDTKRYYSGDGVFWDHSSSATSMDIRCCLLVMEWREYCEVASFCSNYCDLHGHGSPNFQSQDPLLCLETLYQEAGRKRAAGRRYCMICKRCI